MNIYGKWTLFPLKILNFGFSKSEAFEISPTITFSIKTKFGYEMFENVWIWSLPVSYFTVSIYLVKVNNVNTSRIIREICSKLTIKVPLQGHWQGKCGSVLNYLNDCKVFRVVSGNTRCFFQQVINKKDETT